MSKTVMLDGQILHGLDQYGWWQVNEMDGWDQSPEEKSNTEERPLADGDYDTVVRYSRRLVTMSGRLVAKTPEQAFLARERLSALLRDTGVFQVEQMNFARWSPFARRGRISPGRIRGRLLTYRAEIRFNDPRKFGEQHTVPGSVGSPGSVFHRGTHPAWQVVTVTGSSGGGYTITLNGQSVVVTQPLVSGTPHVLDYRTGILRIGGSVIRGGISTAGFSPVLPGMPQDMSISAGSFSALYHDTFI